MTHQMAFGANCIFKGRADFVIGLVIENKRALIVGKITAECRELPVQTHGGVKWKEPLLMSKEMKSPRTRDNAMFAGKSGTLRNGARTRSSKECKRER